MCIGQNQPKSIKAFETKDPAKKTAKSFRFQNLGSEYDWALIGKEVLLYIKVQAKNVKDRLWEAAWEDYVNPGEAKACTVLAMRPTSLTEVWPSDFIVHIFLLRDPPEIKFSPLSRRRHSLEHKTHFPSSFTK